MDNDQAPAGFFGQTAGDANVATKTRIGHKKQGNHGVRALGRFNGLFESDLAALVLSVGDDDDGFAAGFTVELIAASKVDGVVQSGADHVAAYRSGISGDVSAAGSLDAGLVDGAIEDAAVVGEVSEEVDVGVKRDDHGLIALAQDSVKEAASGVLNRSEHGLFAAGGVKQQSEGDGKSHLF